MTGGGAPDPSRSAETRVAALRVADPADPLPRPPGPRGSRLVGPLYEYERDPLGYLTAAQRRYGDVFALTPAHTVLCDPQDIRGVLARTNEDFQLVTGRTTRRTSMMSDRVDVWTRARRDSSWHLLGRDVFARDEADMADRLRTAFTRVSGRRRLGLAQCEEVVAEAGLGLVLADISPRLRALVLDAARAAQAGAAATIRLPIAFSPTRRRIVRANDRLFHELTEAVARRRAAPSASGPRDLLDLLLAPGSDEPGERLTTAEIAQVLAANLANLPAVAGAALSWLMVMMAAHGTEPPPSRSDREWRTAFVNETLRLHPPIWIIVRRVNRDLAVAGHALAAGSQVLLSPKLAHLDPRWWSRDPSVFDPARWFDAAPHVRHAYLPYGAGPRVCTGAQLAQAILETAFDVLRADWTITSRPAEPKPKPATVVTPDRLRLSLVARGSR